MSIYLGSEGQIAIQRSAVGTGAQALATTLEPGDVTVSERRFSADFPSSVLINGDHVEIATQDKSILQLVKGHAKPDGEWYCHIDKAGGIRLYTDFDNAIIGKKSDALELVAPTKSQKLYIRTQDESYNFVGQTTEWSLTTQREAVDLTVLGEDFRDSYANGLISGQGQTSCLWEYKYDKPCDTWKLNKKELPHYYAQLLLRLEQGSLFKGQFFIHYEPSNSVWYQADCVVTSVGFAFAPQQLVRTNIQFVTSGEIKLLIGSPSNKLALEDNNVGRLNTGLLLQDSYSPIDLETDD